MYNKKLPEMNAATRTSFRAILSSHEYSKEAFEYVKSLDSQADVLTEFAAKLRGLVGRIIEADLSKLSGSNQAVVREIVEKHALPLTNFESLAIHLLEFFPSVY